MNPKVKYQITVAFILGAIIFLTLNQPISTEIKAYFTTAFGTLLIVFAYSSGLMAYLVGLGSAVLGFVISLPGIAIIYGLISGYSILIYRKIILYTIEKILGRIPFVQQLIFKVATSETYNMIVHSLDRMLARVGLRKIKRIKLYEVEDCPHCMREIPLESKVCMYCGKEVLLE